MDEPQWTLRELAAEVAAQLERNYAAGDNGQVRAVPDERSIRYYTTLGLIDRPGAMKGRTALYGRRHLAQLVAIKRMQAVGKPLAEIQRVLPTLDDATLSRVSGVVLPKEKRARESNLSFWKATPQVAQTTPAALRPALTLPMPGGVTITFTPARAPTDADVDALRTAAAPLLAELLRRGLLPKQDEEEETP